mmetsp:Transcript_33090/g.82599  ORF Transcript_33090/g.82599 Transcript_33090/m.82599 type:complete len:259 (-) Transcript_33090:57-833(-)
MRRAEQHPTPPWRLPKNSSQHCWPSIMCCCWLCTPLRAYISCSTARTDTSPERDHAHFVRLRPTPMRDTACTAPTEPSSPASRAARHLQQRRRVPVGGGRGRAVQEGRRPAEEGELHRVARRALDRVERRVKIDAEHERRVDGHQLVARQQRHARRLGGALVEDVIDADAAAATLVLNKGNAHRLGERHAHVVVGVVRVDERDTLLRLLRRHQLLVEPQPPVEWRDAVCGYRRLLGLVHAVEEPHPRGRHAVAQRERR